MRRLLLPAFDDVVTGTTPVYSDASLNEQLGRFDQLSIQIVADQVSGTTPTITVAIEHCNDGRNWIPKSGSSVGPTPLATTSTNVLSLADSGTDPSMALVRLRVTLAGGTTAQAHVKIQVCSRDEG